MKGKGKAWAREMTFNNSWTSCADADGACEAFFFFFLVLELGLDSWLGTMQRSLLMMMLSGEQGLGSFSVRN